MCYSIQKVPKVYENINRQPPTLISTDNQVSKPLRYSEQHAPSTHVEEVEKSIGEQGRTQSLVETFTGQAKIWWETHSHKFQTWMTVSMYFFERFTDKNLSKEADIPIFRIGNDPLYHIQCCEIRWRKIGYKYERVWPHMFPNTLDDMPNKWYKIEESCSHTSN